MEKIAMQVAGMSCAHCERAIVNALEDLGARSITANAETGLVQFEIDKSVVAIECVRDELNEMGYTVTA